MELVAIDSHVHIHDERARAMQGSQAKERFEARARYLNRPIKYVSIDDQAEQYRERNMMAVLVNVTDESNTGISPVPNDFVADAVSEYPDVFMGMGVIDPWQGELARKEIVRIKELGLHGIGELNPARQHFYPNDRKFYPLWEEAQAQELPVLFHSGYAATGSGMPGGGGIKLKYVQPLLIDDIAADFPALTIICAHPSWPWTAESLAIARHKPNVYIDLSGWAPKYFPSELVQQVNKLIPEKTLFGTDAPGIPLERWLREFEELDIREDSRRMIMLENARRIFGLTSGESDS